MEFGIDEKELTPTLFESKHATSRSRRLPKILDSRVCGEEPFF